MNSNFIVKLALTTAFVAVPTMGCTTVGVSSNMSSVKPDAGAQKAHAWAKKAEKAFAQGKLDKALPLAEMAVEADMSNRDYRDLLARIYMADGRFKSAEQTLMDVMELGQTDPRTVISLALTRIAQGRVESAIALVEANRSIVPASDYGLALALAGQTSQAVEVLTTAIRADSASSRTRQNLALAYALDGRWREARIMAVQDMPQDMVNQRIAEWAQFARPGAYELRVASLLKVTPREDAGQPVRLALANVNNSLAQSGVVDSPATTPDALDTNAVLAALGPAPTPDSIGFAAAEKDADVAITQIAIPGSQAHLIQSSNEPIKIAPAATHSEKPAKLAIADVAPKKAVNGTHLVQLGAFSSSANAQKAWDKLRERYGVLSGFSSASSTLKVNGKTFTRLAASGFGNKASADAVCKQIKLHGGDCIVRSVSGTQPVRMASVTGRQVASR